MPNPNPQPDPTRTPRRPEPPAVSGVRSVASEDLRPGDYVTVIDADAQLYPFETGNSFDKPRRAELLAYIPDDAGLPRKVVRVGPPFLLVKRPSGHHETIDVRLTRLFRVSDDYGKEAFEKLDPQYLARKRAAEAKRKAKAKKLAKAQKKRDKKAKDQGRKNKKRRGKKRDR
ncbi:MAG: hypothetical protein AAF916_02210 [Planctomycetota bacterium]